MGSSGEGGEFWWQSNQLSPADLRQHAESWSLAADAATATLLQSISQRLVSRTHEVEGALERVVEEADRVLTSISNTNNAFHMLANTQFIENRTYQDDADVAKREKPEPTEKQVTVTEEEVFSRCRAALTDGLTLAGTCYDRHEIQDSDSEDEDSPDSPVPVYALVDPYEGRPLPLIIGSEAFLADDKVGLREDVTSSDENSKATTLSPDETDNESGEDTRDEIDRVALTPKAIPATSSRLTDDESDSDWTDEGGLAPVANPARPQPPQLSSDEDDDDDDEDFFGPSSKAGISVVSNNRINRTINASKNRVIDSDSDDEGGLFGKPQQQQQQQQQPSLFGGPQALPKSRGSSNSSLFGNPDGNPAAGRKDTGSVENVRAMPNPTQSLPPASVKNHKSSSNLFASDSDDDGNLFSSKKAVTGKVKGQSNKGEEHERRARSSGLFSSDDDAPLFSATPANGTDNNQEDEPDKSDEPQPKSSGKKFQVPVGGVRLFGSDITSALRRQKPSDSEASDDNEDDWGGSSRPSSTSLHKPEPPPISSNQSQVTKRSDNIKGGGGGLGLFDEDEDDEDLFSAAVKTSSASKTAKNKKNELDPHAQEKSKSVSKKSGETVIAKTEVPSVGKIFSDDDDDLFGAPKEPNLTQPLPKEDTAVRTKGKGGPSTSRPADLPLPTENIQKPSQPVKIPEPPKTLGTSLFSSPSDDDDLFSAPKLSQVSTKPSSAFVTDPPPIIQDSDTKKSGKLSAPPASGSQAVSTKEPSNKNAEVKTDKAVNKLQPPPTNRLFSSPSDEDELFAADSNKQDDLFTAPASKTQIGSIKEPSNASVGGVTTSKTGDKLQPPTTPRLFSSPSDEDDLFSAAPKAPDAASTSVEGKASTKGDKLRPPNTPRLFSSPSDEDELFASVAKMPNPPSTNVEVKPEEKLKPPPSGRLFSSPSDEDELFSGAPKSAEVQETQEKVLSEKSAAISQSSADTAVNTTQRSDLEEKSQSSIFDSPEDDMFKSKALKSGGKSSLFASNLDEDIDDIFAGPVSKSQSSSRALVDTKKTISNIFEGVDDDDDIFASTQKDPKPKKASTQSNPSITNVSNIVSHVESEKEKPGDENKTFVDTEKESSVPASVEEVAPPIQPKVKKPIGGVALFGGAELANQLSKRKSMLGNDVQTKDADKQKGAPPQGSDLFKPEENLKPSQDKLFKSKEEKSSSKSGIFGSESDDDNLFGSSSPPTVSPGNNPPRLSPTKDTSSTVPPPSKPKDLPSKPKAVPAKPQKEPKAEEMKKEEDQKSQVRVVPNDPGVIEKSKDRSESESKEKEKESGETSGVRIEATTPSKKEAKTVVENKEKDQETAETRKEKEEVKPKKKPPIGGVSMFGGGGIGGKELLAKVQKRKSMLAPESESESDEEPTITASAQSHTSGTSLPPDEKSGTGGTSPSLASPVSPSPRSPLSPIPVFLPTASSNVIRKSGGEESSVSFDDPASSTSTLESLNKTRARGSIKRRPPTRAHRKSAISNQDPSETPTSATNPDSDTTTNTVSTKSESISQPATTIAQSVTTAAATTISTANSEPQNISAPSEKDTHAAAIDRVDSPHVNATDSAVGGNKDPVTNKGNLNPGMTGESKKDAVKDEDSGLVTKSNSALHQSKQEPVTKASSSSKASSSLFGGSDSEDEDLFGKKPKSQPVKTSEAPVSNNVTKQTDKTAKPVSLFGDDDDDDDDIFSSGAKARSAPVTARQSSTSKPKTNLKTSSEPFEDPLLGNLK